MNTKPIRCVGHPDFHDRQILSLAQVQSEIQVNVVGSTGKHYLVRFEGVRSVESDSPEEMMLYGLSEADGESESLRRCDFVNRFVASVNNPPILLGTSSFTAAGWQGSFYPKGMRPADYLAFYAEHFHPIEVDASQGTKAE